MSEASHQILPPNLISSGADGGRIAENILQFSRLLRAAGLPVGPDRVVLATKAAIAAGLDKMAVFRAALEAALVSRPEERIIFHAAFQIYWKEPGLLSRTPIPGLEDHSTKSDHALARRLLEPLLANKSPGAAPEEQLEFDAKETYSSAEVFRNKDFDQMSAAELFEARRAIAEIELVSEEILTRRLRPSKTGGHFDCRKILREMSKKGPDHIALHFKARTRRQVPLVVLIDISGSMDTYARMMLHFLYALINARPNVHAFLFGTELSNVTRKLAGRDADVAIDKVARDVKDWSGGTRIGQSLHAFNKHWARRVLGQDATVLLVTDGLDRQGGDGIATEARRLSASCRRLVWLNPLLRYGGYQPLARGARELVRYVDVALPCHTLRSFEDLANALNGKRSAVPIWTSRTGGVQTSENTETG